MLSTQLVNYLGTTLYPMVEGAVYLDANNIGSIEFTPDTLYIIEGIINPAESTEYVFPEGCILKFNHNSYFGNNVTLRFVNSTTSEVTSFTVVAPLQKIFDGTRIIGFFQNAEIPVEWFGAVGDGLTDDSAAINACIKYSAMQTVLLGANSYLVESPILFVESNWESETFANTHTKWPISKNFICKGIIIGGASVDPVMIVYQGANIIDINTIQVLNTNAKSRGIVILSQCHQKFSIGKILKVNDGQGIPIPESHTLPEKRSGYAVILGGYIYGGTFEFGKINGFDYGICFSSTHTGDMNAYIDKNNICQVQDCTFYILTGIQNTSYPISNDFTTFSKVPFLYYNNIYINGGLNSNDFNNDTSSSSIFSNPATYINFKYTGVNSQVAIEANNIISNKLTGSGLRYLTLDWGKYQTFNTNLGSLHPWHKNNVDLKAEAYKSNFPDSFNDYTDYNIIDLRRQRFTTINHNKSSYQPIEIVSYFNCVNTEITNMALYNTYNDSTYTYNVLFDKVIFTRDNREQELINSDNIWERRLLGTTTWDNFINDNNISIDTMDPVNQELYDFVMDNDPSASLHDIITDKSLAEYIFTRKSLTDLVLHEQSCKDTSIIKSFKNTFYYDNTIILIEPHYKHLQDIEYVSELPVNASTNKWYAVPVTNHGKLPKYKVYIYDTVKWIGKVEGTPNLYFYKKYDVGMPNEVIDNIYMSMEKQNASINIITSDVNNIESSIIDLDNDIYGSLAIINSSIGTINTSIAIHDASILDLYSELDNVNSSIDDIKLDVSYLRHHTGEVIENIDSFIENINASIDDIKLDVSYLRHHTGEVIENIDSSIENINASIAMHDASIVYILGQL